MHGPTADAYQNALALLLSRIDYERATSLNYGHREFKLDRMHDLLARLGHPEQRLATMHITGTKGKGSTVAMTAAMLTAAGFRTGTFTSPHIDRIEERLSIGGTPCPTDKFIHLVEALRPIVADMDVAAQRASSPEIGPTYFELTTALAWMYFLAERVDAVVLEVGMGGRLDSTNVCTPAVTAITSISFDHMKQLGNTLAAIAGEKAGIIKPGVPVVSGVTDPEPRDVIREVAVEHVCRLVELDRDFEVAYHPPSHETNESQPARIDFTIRAPDGKPQRLEGVELGLVGSHQAANAGVALAIVEELTRQGWAIPETAIRRGLADVRLPARVEVLSRRPTVIVDGAHNLASVRALLKTLEESFACKGRKVLVFATTKDKDVRGMLAQLLPNFDRVVLTRYESNPRGVSVEELTALADELGARHYVSAPTPAAGWQQVRGWLEPEDLACITGSFFAAAELRRLILADRPVDTPSPATPAGA
jgi:dihydrofolate synthase/folylpolyglutamate synthase